MLVWSISKKRKTKTLKNGDSFIVVQQMTQGDKDELNDLLMRMDVNNKKGKKPTKKELKDESTQSAQLMLGSMRHFQRVRSIKSWNLKDDDGRDVSLTEDNIRLLPSSAVKQVDEAIEELNPELEDDDKKE